MRYLPFLDGKYVVTPGLNAMAKADVRDQFVFQLDDQYADFMGNKMSCRNEDVHKYYAEEHFSERTKVAVNQFFVNHLVKEYPGVFAFTFEEGHFSLFNRRKDERLTWQEDWIRCAQTPWLSLFEALCHQVQEDIAVCQIDGDRDWLAAIHLSAPNHWDPANKIGKPFGAVHGPVPGMEKLNQSYFKMLLTAVQKGPFFRFAWGIATDTRLNHHPLAPADVDPAVWQGRQVAVVGSEDIWLRVERQTISGLPECSAFFFTIRTYFYPINSLSPEEKKALMMAVEGMSAESLAYKGLAGGVDNLKACLKLDHSG
jgi:Haem-dependent oxidative N-demethylase, alpha subunit-like